MKTPKPTPEIAQEVIEYFQAGANTPVWLGDVKEKISELLDTKNNREFEVLNDLDRHWLDCGFEKSLQQILDEQKKFNGEAFCPCGKKLELNEPHRCDAVGPPIFKKYLKSPAAELFGYLHNLIPTP